MPVRAWHKLLLIIDSGVGGVSRLCQPQVPALPNSTMSTAVSQGLRRKMLRALWAEGRKRPPCALARSLCSTPPAP